jgi:hypothetical protein
MFTDKELKYLKNIVKIINEAKFDLKGEEIMHIAASLTVLQSSIIPKVEQMVEKPKIPAPKITEPKPESKSRRKKKAE